MKRTIPYEQYLRKLEGCFIGKSVGGTLGGPYEGQEGPLALAYYDPVPDRMLPNDDLDLQVVWLEIIRRKGLPVNRQSLASGWLENIQMFPDEYAVAHRNIQRGLYPPMSGAFDNDFTNGMGAAIRSEIWASLAPGCPGLAVRLAREDACADHDGDGIDACVFFAALQSMAFLESGRDTLLERAFAYLPDSSRVKRAMLDTLHWWRQEGDWLRVRNRIWETYAVDNWTDVAMNLGFIVLGWVAGGGDFGKSICIANNCGGDTDCTAATLGALMGLIDPGCMGGEWTAPIGRELVLSPSMAGMHPCATLDAFCLQLAELAPRVLAYFGADMALEGAGTCGGHVPDQCAAGRDILLAEDYSNRESLLAVTPLSINLLYPEGWVFLPGKPAALRLRLANPLETPVAGSLEFTWPFGWRVEPAGAAVSLAPGQSMDLALTVTAPGEDAVRTCTNFLDLRMCLNGIPVTVSAGLPQSIPWLWGAFSGEGRGIGGLSLAPLEANGNTQQVPAGSHCFVTDIKVPRNMTAIYLAQAKGAVELWIDGKLANSHDSGFFAPACHRHEGTGVEMYLDQGWHRVAIWVTAKKPGPLHFGVNVAARRAGGYVADMEYRMPRI